MDLVSVIIPVYNAEHTLLSCVESVLNQTYPEIELILINDGSSDGSARICDSLKRTDSRVVFVSRQNSGVSKTRNEGIRRAKGKYVIFLDADDSLERDAVSLAVSQADAYAADVVFWGFTYVFDDRSSVNFEQNAYGGDKEGFFRNHFISMLEKEQLNPPWNKLIRRDFLINNDIFFKEDFAICEDMIFNAELLTNCERTAIIDKTLYYYHIGSVGTLVSTFREYHYKALQCYYNKMQGYCSRFDNNQEQLKALSRFFVRRVIAIVNRLFSNNVLTDSKRKRLFYEVAKSETFKETARSVHLVTKEEIYKRLILLANYRIMSALHVLMKYSKGKK